MSLQILDFALTTVSDAASLVTAIHKRDRSLADQIRRALQSIVLNLAEADGNLGGNARVHFSRACGSAKEARVAIRLATAWGYIGSIKTIDDALDRIAATTWKLSR